MSNSRTARGSLRRTVMMEKEREELLRASFIKRLQDHRGGQARRESDN
jgi:hypothetical protein